MRVNKKKKLKEISEMITREIELAECDFTKFNYEGVLKEIDLLQKKFWEMQDGLSVKDRLFIKSPCKNPEYKLGYEICYNKFLREEIVNDEVLKTYKIFNQQIELIENAINAKVDTLQLECIDDIDDILIKNICATYGESSIKVNFVTGNVTVCGEQSEDFYWDDFKLIQDGKFIGRKDIKQIKLLEKNLSTMFPSSKMRYLKKYCKEIKEMRRMAMALIKSPVQEGMLYQRIDFIMKLYNKVAECIPKDYYGWC